MVVSAFSRSESSQFNGQVITPYGITVFVWVRGRHCSWMVISFMMNGRRQRLVFGCSCWNRLFFDLPFLGIPHQRLARGTALWMRTPRYLPYVLSIHLRVHEPSPKAHDRHCRLLQLDATTHQRPSNLKTRGMGRALRK